MDPTSPPATPRGIGDAPVAWTDLGGRGTLIATGSDAAAFVDKFTTAPVGRLTTGFGMEGFFADVRGWVLGFTALLRTDEGLLIDCDALVATMLRDHLEHYHIREAVELLDASADFVCLAIAGAEADGWLRDRFTEVIPPGAPLRHAPGQLGPAQVHLMAVDWFGPGGCLVRVAPAEADTLGDWLERSGATRVDPSSFDTARIERRVPSAADIPEKTLPQELDRTDRAISFTKGCYLGQETVARIDALGHVNRRLVLVAIEGDAAPSPGSVVTCGGEAVGRLTSTCISPRHGACGLALVHRRGLEPMASLQVAGRAARVAPHEPRSLENS